MQGARLKVLWLGTLGPLVLDWQDRTNGMVEEVCQLSKKKAGQSEEERGQKSLIPSVITSIPRKRASTSINSARQIDKKM